MTELYPARTDDAGRTYFEPVLAKITGTSQYREDEFRLEGIEGFWSAGKVNIPPIVKNGETIAWFTLAQKPKSGKNAKPGSMYRDIVVIKPATPDDKASYNPSAPSPADYIAPEPATGQNGAHSASTGNVWDVRDQQIKLGMAFNNLTTALFSPGGLSVLEDMLGGTPYEHLLAQWWEWFSEASQGKPLSPAEGQASELAPDQNASPLVEAAKAMGATETEATDAARQEIEELPW